jgi:hypothetical protein
VGVVLLLLAVAVLGVALGMLRAFVRSSSRDPLTPQAPDARSARARRWAGVYVRRPDATVLLAEESWVDESQIRSGSEK